MAEVTSLLRSVYQERRLQDIIEGDDGRIVFASSPTATDQLISWPKDTKTAFRIHGSETEDGEWDHYSLEDVLNFPLRILAQDRDEMLSSLLGREEEARSEAHEMKSWKGTVYEEEEKENGTTSQADLDRDAKEPPEKKSKANLEPCQLSPAQPGSIAPSLVDPDQHKVVPTKLGRFEGLPDEILLRILSHVSQQDIATRVSFVCHKFRDLCVDASLWTSLRIPRHVTLRASIQLLDRCKLLKKLQLRYSDCSVDLAIYALTNCPMLSYISVHVEDNLFGLLRAIGTYGNSLRRLALYGGCDPEVLEDNAECLQGLTSLLVHKIYSDFDDSCLGSVTRHCTLLQKLILYAGEISEEALLSLSNLRQLETLSLDFFDQGSREMGLGQMGLLAVGELPRLKVLQLNAADIGLDIASAFREGRFKTLREFQLSDNITALEDNDPIAIADCCPDLTRLELDLDAQPEVKDESILYLMSACKELLELRISGSRQTTEKILECLPPKLRRMSIQDDYNGYFAEGYLENFEARHPGLKLDICY